MQVPPLLPLLFVILQQDASRMGICYPNLQVKGAIFEHPIKVQAQTKNHFLDRKQELECG